MKCLCLRDCFANGIFYAANAVYDLDNDGTISPKNFKSLSDEPIKSYRKNDSFSVVLQETVNGETREELLKIF